MNPQDEVTPINGQLPPVIPHEEASKSAGDNGGVTQANNMSGPQSTSAVQNNSSVAAVSSGQISKSPHAPSIADDNDLIEKEWVNRAKMIIAKTKDDPREQSEELFKYKADYIKKRYNKDIKVSES